MPFQLTTLAPELLLEILTHLVSDPPSLLKCALLCRTILPYAREVMFRDTLLIEKSLSAARTRQFAELLESNPDLGSIIRVLRVDLRFPDGAAIPAITQRSQVNLIIGGVRIPYDIDPRVWQNPCQLTDVLGTLPLSRLTELRELILGSGIEYRDPVGQLVTLLKALPRLKELRVQGGRLIGFGVRHYGESLISTPAEHELPPLKLKTLEFCYEPRFPLGELVRALQGSLALESLVLHCSDWDDLVEHHAGWIPLISTMKASLRHLDISTGERDHQNVVVSYGAYGYSPFHTWLFNALRDCESLETLRLHYLLPDYIEPTIDLTRADFMQSLCGLLESCPAFADSLKKLELLMVDYDGLAVSIDRTLGTRLARVLADMNRYPKMLELQVRVRIQDPLDDDLSPEVPPREKELDTEVQARWLGVLAEFAKGANGMGFQLEIY